MEARTWWRAAAAVVAPLRGPAAAKEEGKSERGPRGVYPLPRLGLGHSEEGCPRRRAVSGGGGSAGGAAGREGELEVVLGVVVLGSGAGAYL